MKILAFSDLHCDVAATKSILEQSQGADVLVAAGDFATRGIGAADTISLLRAHNAPTILVGGNHDNAKELKALCKGWKNGYLLHGQSIKIAGTSFFGMGYEILTGKKKPAWNAAISEEQAALLLTNCPKKCVLVTHNPPFGCADLQRDGTHQGSRVIRKTIKQKKPVLHLCGHVHFSQGSNGIIGITPVHNLGPVANWFEV